MKKYSTIIVNTDQPMRLDRFLRHNGFNQLQSMIEQTLRKGLIKVNGKKSPANQRVVSKDVITVSYIVQLNKENKEEKLFSKSAVALSSKLLNEYLIYEDQNILVINKPSGLASQGGSKVSLSVDDAIKHLNQSSKMDLRLVHRLDKDTSGLLIIAKDYPASVKLGKTFQENLIKKIYIAVVHGKPRKLSGEIENIIGKNTSGKFERVEEIKSQHNDFENSEGRVAITKYKLLKSMDGFSLMQFSPLTGRMHQLRVHAAKLGTPIVGDIKYGGQQHSSRHMMLHAQSITLPKEIFGKFIELEAPLPDYFKDQNFTESAIIKTSRAPRNY